ncbi:glutamate racemase [Noviherbaspirillum humi]|nr:glutamate racemase [Noviherbaspirillum humi]
MPLDAPIGIFDSGIGGLSVLRHVHALLPQENLLYFADAGFAPYGGKPEAEILERSAAIAGFLRQSGAKAVVVACNTATAAAIAHLRALHPDWAVVGVEPGLKPAAAASRSTVVGVLATERTVASEKFRLLRQRLEAESAVRFVCSPCPGLADAIEAGQLRSPDTAALLTRFLMPLLEAGADTIVLGCTHYPFVAELIHAIANRAGRPVQLIDTGEAVARQLARLLSAHDCLHAAQGPGSINAFTTGSAGSLDAAFHRLLGMRVQSMALKTAS